MFARTVAVRLRPNCLNQFKQILDEQIIPILHKRPGFKDLITFALEGGTDITAISLWETRKDAELYHTVSYTQVMNTLELLLDGSPKLRIADIVSSTFHQATGRAAA